jgi:hypothetical protein
MAGDATFRLEQLGPRNRIQGRGETLLRRPGAESPEENDDRKEADKEAAAENAHGFIRFIQQLTAQHFRRSSVRWRSAWAP